MANNQALVDFSKVLESDSIPGELAKELRIVQTQLNLKPSEKDGNRYVASKTNIAVMNHLEFVVRKISSMVEQGLSLTTNDYYVYADFGGSCAVKKSPHGMIKSMCNAATRAGYLANVNVGCIFEGYQLLKVKRDGINDTIELENDPDAESGIVEGKVVAPFAVVTLFHSGVQLSRKVTIVRQGEYKSAVSQSKGNLHKYYPVPGAQKIALKRGAEEMLASMGVADEQLQEDIADHNDGYDMDREPAPAVEQQPEQPGEAVIAASDDQVKTIDDLFKAMKVGKAKIDSTKKKHGVDEWEQLSEVDAAELIATLAEVKASQENRT